MRNLSAAIAIIFAVECVMSGVVEQQPREYYVSPHGDDNNAGSFSSPWRTINHSIERLSRGDVLYLREGRYYEHEIRIGLKGTALEPITIQAYPGERAIIDGGMPYFAAAPNAEWELVDGNIHLYRSKRTFVGTFVRAWLMDDDIQLIEYEDEMNMMSVNYDRLDGMTPFYMGPGVQLRSDGHIYIRLQYNPTDLTDSQGSPIDPLPADIDPNKNKIAIFVSENIFLLDGVEYIHIKNIELSYAKVAMDLNTSSYVELSGCTLNFGSYGLVIRGGVHHWNIHDCEFNNGLPDYVYWTDVKNGSQEVAEAYPEFQSTAINGPMITFDVHNNLFRDAFDAFHVDDGSTDVRIANNILKNMRDDGLELSRGISDVEIAHNMLWHVGSGISNLGSDTSPGHVYIHHNVIDNSAYQRGGRSGNYRSGDWPVWTVIDPFGSHGSGNQASWWKIYNNTIVTRRSGYNWHAAGPTAVTGNPELYVYNNIFYVIDDRIVYRDDLAALGSHYDGNVIYRRAPGKLPLFLQFGDGGDYGSLADFRSHSGTDWEVNGLEIDPGIDLARISDPDFDPATIWQRYRPMDSRVFTPGASYSGLNWPGTAGVTYRGALPPASMHPPVFLPLVVRTGTARLSSGGKLAAGCSPAMGCANPWTRSGGRK